MHRRRLSLGSRAALVLGNLILGHLVWGALGSLPLAAETGPVYLRRSEIAPDGASPQVCPTDLQMLTPQLLADLPSYANRVASRTATLDQLLTEPRTTLLVTSPADLTPIDLAELGPGGEGSGDSGLQQVFFTTLERQFWPDRIVSLQHHHWLFLAQSPQGWRLALLYSSVDTLNSSDRAPNRAPTPPQETSDGIVGQAVRLWLRDCQAGAVFSDMPATRSPAAGTMP